jgi:hypothetical protein
MKLSRVLLLLAPATHAQVLVGNGSIEPVSIQASGNLSDPCRYVMISTVYLL